MPPAQSSDTAQTDLAGEHGEIREQWQDKSLTDLMGHITKTHHVYCRSEIPRIRGLFKEAIREHGEAHPKLKTMHDLFYQVTKDLMNHMEKEEQTLFPFITRFESSVQAKEPVSWPPFGTVGNPIRIMIVEHGKTTLELEQMREMAQSYELPADASEALRELYSALVGFAADMERHVATEEAVLFPRAVEMETEACAPKPAGE